METKQIRVEPDVADQLAVLAEEVGMPRPSFIRLLVIRYGQALRLELSSPARLTAGDLQPVAAPSAAQVPPRTAE